MQNKRFLHIVCLINVPDEQAEETLLVGDDSVGSDEATLGPLSVSKQHVLLKFFKLIFGLVHHNKSVKYH